MPTLPHFGPAALSRLSGLLAVCWLLLGVPASAHTKDPGELPLIPRSLALKHRRPAEIVALFAREQYPAGAHVPRAACSAETESLVPDGSEMIRRTNTPGELEIVCAEGSQFLEECIEELDVPVEELGPDRRRVVLTLRQANAAAIRAAVLRLPGAGSAAVSGRRLVLTGRPAWMHRALRCVIRAQFGFRDLMPPAIP